MNGLQVSITCLLLKMTFDPISAQLLRCPTCAEGYFVTKNCSVIDGGSSGVQCKLCTDCSAADQETLAECSTFSDSLCGNKTIQTTQIIRTTAAVTWTQTSGAAVSAPDVWVVLIMIVLSLFLVLLISLFLILLSCRQRQPDKIQGLDPL